MENSNTYYDPPPPYTDVPKSNEIVIYPTNPYGFCWICNCDGRLVSLAACPKSFGNHKIDGTDDKWASAPKYGLHQNLAMICFTCAH